MSRHRLLPGLAQAIRNFVPVAPPEEGGGDWWLPTGIVAGDVRAAYQPIGAADLAASYANLNDPGTNDAALGNAPSFSAVTGWTFNGTDDNLTVGSLTSAKPQSIFARITLTDLAALYNISGCSSAGGLGYRVQQTTGQIYLLKENVALIGASTSNLSAGVDLVVGYTYGAAGAWAIYIDGVAAGTGTDDHVIAADAMFVGLGVGGYFKGVMSAISIYDVALSSDQAAELSTAMAAL